MDDQQLELKIHFLDHASKVIFENKRNFLMLKQDPSIAYLIDRSFFLAHSLKSGAKVIGFSEVIQLIQEFEMLLLKIRNSEVGLTQ